MAHDDEATAVAFSTYIQSPGLNICLSPTVFEVIGGRKSQKSASSQGSPRTQSTRGGGSQSAIKLGRLPGGHMSFTARVRKDLSTAKRSSGRRSYSKSSKPRTGRYNSRGRGVKALAGGIGPNRSWQTFDGDPMRFRSRLVIV